LGEVFRVSIGDDALCLVAQRELGVAEERLVGGCDEPTCHLQNGIGGSGRDPGGQFLCLRFLFRGQRLGHDDLRPE
jgi:hypothetical protein